jgi:hypothetical protein
MVAPRVGTRIQLSDNDIDEVVAAHQDPWWEACAAADDRD